MQKYTEIFKLKRMLEENNIPFDWIPNWGYDIKKIIKLKNICPDLIEHYQICYPCFNVSLRKISVIQGFGTYGNEKDLLEIMGLLSPEEAEYDVVQGYLSAENVFERIKEDYIENKEE